MAEPPGDDDPVPEENAARLAGHRRTLRNCLTTEPTRVQWSGEGPFVSSASISCGMDSTCKQMLHCDRLLERDVSKAAVNRCRHRRRGTRWALNVVASGSLTVSSAAQGRLQRREVFPAGVTRRCAGPHRRAAAHAGARVAALELESRTGPSPRRIGQLSAHVRSSDLPGPRARTSRPAVLPGCLLNSRPVGGRVCRTSRLLAFKHTRIPQLMVEGVSLSAVSRRAGTGCGQLREELPTSRLNFKR